MTAPTQGERTGSPGSRALAALLDTGPPAHARSEAEERLRLPVHADRLAGRGEAGSLNGRDEAGALDGGGDAEALNGRGEAGSLNGRGEADALDAGGEAAREALREPAREPERTGPRLEDGTRVSEETARPLSCDAGVGRIVHRRGGRLVEIQGKRRTIPPRLRRALELRGCRFPGCRCRFTQVHHVNHGIHCGATRLGNAILACRLHHRLLHEGRFRVEMDPSGPGRPVFYDPRSAAGSPRCRRR